MRKLDSQLGCIKPSLLAFKLNPRWQPYNDAQIKYSRSSDCTVNHTIYEF